jgi:hypothetical protein
MSWSGWRPIEVEAALRAGLLCAPSLSEYVRSRRAAEDIHGGNPGTVSSAGSTALATGASSHSSGSYEKQVRVRLPLSSHRHALSAASDYSTQRLTERRNRPRESRSEGLQPGYRDSPSLRSRRSPTGKYSDCCAQLGQRRNELCDIVDHRGRNPDDRQDGRRGHHPDRRTGFPALRHRRLRPRKEHGQLSSARFQARASAVGAGRRFKVNGDLRTLLASTRQLVWFLVYSTLQLATS